MGAVSYALCTQVTARTMHIVQLGEAHMRLRMGVHEIQTPLLTPDVKLLPHH